MGYRGIIVKKEKSAIDFFFEMKHVMGMGCINLSDECGCEGVELEVESTINQPRNLVIIDEDTGERKEYSLVDYTLDTETDGELQQILTFQEI